MKIVIAANTAWYVHNFRGGLIRSLVNNDSTVIVVAPQDRFSEELKSMGCSVYDIPIDNKGRNPLVDLRTIMVYRSLYKRIGPDVVLNFTVKPVVYSSFAAQSLHIPCINTITGLGTAFISQTVTTQIVSWFYKLALKRSHTVFFQNMDDRRLFASLKIVALNKSRQVAGSGVNVSRFTATEPPLNKVFIFLFIARLLRDKGINEYVESARQIIQSGRNVRFQILGGRENTNHSSVISEIQLEHWIEEGIIEYIGEVQDVRPFVKKADCIVLPSYREGLSRTLLEAAAMARPIISTDVPGCREVVIDGVNGFTCRVRDSDELTRAMQKMLNLTSKERKLMGLQGRALVEETYDENTVISEYLQVIQSL